MATDADHDFAKCRRGFGIYIGDNPPADGDPHYPANALAIDTDASAGTLKMNKGNEASANFDAFAGVCLITDSGSLFTATTIEGALAELAQHVRSAQAFLPIPLATVLESDGTNVVGSLGNGTTPTLDLANGDTDSGLIITWTSGNTDAIIFQTPLPPDFDPSSDLVLHLRAKSGGSTDTPAIAADTYFNEGDTKVEDSSGNVSSSVQELTITVAAADIPSGAQTVTMELTPGGHSSDDLILSALWLEYQRKTLTS